MRVIILALALAGCTLGAPPALAHAQESADTGQVSDCQRPFLERATPYLEEMLWYADQANNYPLTPDLRPVVTGWPYSAYGPGNGYGPGSPYGPAFGPWGISAFGPGFGGPYGYGISPFGVGGPAWQVAGAIAGNGVGTLTALPPGVAVSTVANQLAAAPGGLAALAPADQIALGSLGQSLTGNVLSAGSLSQSILGNRIAEASLRQAVVGNRFAAATLNATLAAYPSTIDQNLSQVVQALQAYSQLACPSASDTGSSGGGTPGNASNGTGGAGAGGSGSR